MGITIHLTSQQRKLVIEILNRHLRSSKFYVFGSRSTGVNLKPFSDLDIAVEAPDVIPASALAEASEAFSASELPFHVDLVDLKTLSDTFRSKVAADFKELS